MSGHPIAEQLLITVLQRGGQQINGWIGTFKGMVYEIIEVAWKGNKMGSEVVRAQETLLSKSVLLSQVFLSEWGQPTQGQNRPRLECPERKLSQPRLPVLVSFLLLQQSETVNT